MWCLIIRKIEQNCHHIKPIIFSNKFSKLSNISMSRPIKHRPLKYRIYLLLFRLILSKHTISSHEIVNINHFPHPKSILTQPLHQGLKLVFALEMFWSHHLVLNNDQMLPGVHLVWNWDLLDLESKWSSDT